MRMRLAWLPGSMVVWILILGLTTSLTAADKAAPAALDRQIVDQLVYVTLRDVINHGADLYNSGDQAGCYRLYEGALMALRPVLDHRPELQKTIDAGFAKTEREPSLARRAFILRQEVIDKIRADVKKPDDQKPPVTLTLWERLGGEANVIKIVDDFVAVSADDPKVNLTRNGKFKLDEATVTDLKKKLVDLISSVTGGPRKYTGKSMKDAHVGMGITDAEFDAAAADLKKALEKNGAKPEDVAALLKIVDGTRKDIVEVKVPEKE